jgi:RNA polymerase sigma factor (sigma-70 family)
VQREQAERVRRAVQALPSRYRRVVELRLVHELGHGEIARLLNLSLGAVRVLFCRGLRHVREALGEER